MGRIEDMNGIPGVLMFRMRLGIHINWKSESYAFNFLILPYIYIYIFTRQHPLAPPAKTEESKSHAEWLDGNFATGLANLEARDFGVESRATMATFAGEEIEQEVQNTRTLRAASSLNN
jgi:hypothetical protein